MFMNTKEFWENIKKLYNSLKNKNRKSEFSKYGPKEKRRLFFKILSVGIKLCLIASLSIMASIFLPVGGTFLVTVGSFIAVSLISKIQEFFKKKKVHKELNGLEEEIRHAGDQEIKVKLIDKIENQLQNKFTPQAVKEFKENLCLGDQSNEELMTIYKYLIKDLNSEIENIAIPSRGFPDSAGLLNKLDKLIKVRGKLSGTKHEDKKELNNKKIDSYNKILKLVLIKDLKNRCSNKEYIGKFADKIEEFFKNPKLQSNNLADKLKYFGEFLKNEDISEQKIIDFYHELIDSVKCQIPDNVLEKTGYVQKSRPLIANSTFDENQKYGYTPQNEAKNTLISSSTPMKSMELRKKTGFL